MEVLLKAYLTNNSKVKILWPGSYMMLRYPAFMMRIFPAIADMRSAYPSSEPTALWFQVVA